MKLGMVGLGRMGANMAQRLSKGGHEVVAFDALAKAREAYGGHSVDSLKALVATLPVPRVVWMMVPSGDATEQTKSALSDLLSSGDIIVDEIEKGKQLYSRCRQYVNTTCRKAEASQCKRK